MVQTKQPLGGNNQSKNTGFLPKRCLSTDNLDYEVAIKKLNSLQSNAAVISFSQSQGPLSHYQQALKVESTSRYLAKVGVSLEQLDTLSVIHIAGTKGKGSTAALCESILRHHGYTTGFFSSPHLVQVRERIRLNGHPITTPQFTQYFNDVYNRLNETKENNEDMPAYFKFLTVMAFQVFLKEKVDVAIVEVGIGGEYDCTNCIRKPAVVGITNLGLDHTSILGSTLPDIAWQKSGILKAGAVAYTVPQASPAAMDVLRERAANRKCVLKVAPPLDNYLWDSSSPIGFNAMVEDVYATNASLALQLSNAWLQLQSPFSGTEEFNGYEESDTVPMAMPLRVTQKMSNGIETCTWPGRTQVLQRGHTTFFLDGAHTLDSISYCIKWFQTASATLQPESEAIRRVLVFNITGKRAADDFLRLLKTCDFHDALFTSIVPFKNQNDSSDQFSIIQSDEIINLCETWSALNPNGSCKGLATMSETIDSILEKNEPCHVLITGSVHLVGAALSVLDPELSESVTRIPAHLRPLTNLYEELQSIL